MTESFLYMRLRKAPYTEFKSVSTSLDDFSSLDSSPIFMLNNIPMMEKDNIAMRNKRLLQSQRFTVGQGIAFLEIQIYELILITLELRN